MGDTFQFVINDRSYLNAISRAEMVDWYNSIDVLLCGRPVVTTAVGDMPNSMLDGETGFLVGSHYDKVTAVAVRQAVEQQLQLLAGDRELLDRLGVQARQRMCQLRDWQQLAPRWLETIVQGCQ